MVESIVMLHHELGHLIITFTGLSETYVSPRTHGEMQAQAQSEGRCLDCLVLHIHSRFTWLDSSLHCLSSASLLTSITVQSF